MESQLSLCPPGPRKKDELILEQEAALGSLRTPTPTLRTGLRRLPPVGDGRQVVCSVEGSLQQRACAPMALRVG